jgi:hypothetical protein
MLITASVFYTRVQWFQNLRPLPDMALKDALDYIVNDSIAKLKQPPSPQIEKFGPMAGHLSIEKGVERMDALRQLNERAITGDLDVWGYKEIGHGMPSARFQDVISPIPTVHWGMAQIDPVVTFHQTRSVPATTVLPDYRQVQPRYSGLRVFKEHVRRAWPAKSVFRRFWERTVRGNPRITL